MSTRSGKRIHGSFHENTTLCENELVIKTGRKTRSKRLKENVEETSRATKKRNYVSYPASEDINDNTIIREKKSKEAVPDSPKVTLKEQNLNISTNIAGSQPEKTIRQTRRTKIPIENTEEVFIENGSTDVQTVVPKNKKKSKKNKKKNLKTESGVVEIEEISVPVSKKTKKKRGKQQVDSASFDKSNGSIDSFHSAAGSPVQEHPSESKEVLNGSYQKLKRRSLKRKPDDNVDTEMEIEERLPKKTKLANHDDVTEKELNCSRKSKSSDSSEKKDATFDKTDEVVAEKLNTTFEKEPKSKRKSSLKNTTLDKTDLSLVQLNSTYEKSDSNEKNNLTFENKNNNSARKSLRLSTAIEKQSPVKTLNNTFEKNNESEPPKLNSTFDKETKLNMTNEKVDAETVPDKKSSLISSDSSTNLTFDKSDDCSRISITSDDSNVENIVNTTPVLIESSMDESREKSKLSITPENSNAKVKTSATPLKREGTFTKDGPDVIIMSPKPKLSSERTPVKRMSLPSPGCTPFHVSKSSQKEKSVLNLTHSIEKTGRRSSLIEPIPRMTKVMFCSPVNNPTVVMQQKRKVIKSNLKGSNKSFIFEESASEVVRPAARKRSYTHNDVDDARAKRSRTVSAQNAAATRLSRPRTVSATVPVKPSEPSTPSKKQSAQKTLTPSKKSEQKSSRTKLPNFAALHQKQFSRMESLDECQERKAKRARQLLTPTGTVQVLERSSPRNRGSSVTEPVKALRDPAKKGDTPTKAPRTSTKLPTQTKVSMPTQAKLPALPTQAKLPALPTQAKPAQPTQAKLPTQPTQAKTPALPTLESLRPGFTRFGFKMHTDVNPFSIPPKTDLKPKENKPNGLVKRQLTQPSLNGHTRKEVAKQMVMREKSFTSLSDKRDVKRKESRSMIKGVRTNRRFELQMQMRNVNA